MYLLNLNEAELFFPGSYISQLHSNAHKKTRKLKVLYLGSNEDKNSRKGLNKIQARFAGGK